MRWSYFSQSLVQWARKQQQKSSLFPCDLSDEKCRLCVGREETRNCGKLFPSLMLPSFQVVKCLLPSRVSIHYKNWASSFSHLLSHLWHTETKLKAVKLCLETGYLLQTLIFLPSRKLPLCVCLLNLLDHTFSDDHHLCRCSSCFRFLNLVEKRTLTSFVFSVSKGDSSRLLTWVI